jgi:hypothetical protein
MVWSGLALVVIHIVADSFHMAIGKPKESANISPDATKLSSSHHNGAGLVLHGYPLHSDSPLLLHKA